MENIKYITYICDLCKRVVDNEAIGIIHTFNPKRIYIFTESNIYEPKAPICIKCRKRISNHHKYHKHGDKT